jgi:hypothetical protein
MYIALLTSITSVPESLAIFLELGGFASLSSYFLAHDFFSKTIVLDQSLVSILLNILIVDPKGGREVSSVEWMKLASRCRVVLGPEPYRSEDDVASFAVFATFSAIVLSRFNVLDTGIINFVCGFISSGRDLDEDVEELWFLTVQVFTEVVKMEGVKGIVREGSWVGEWREIVKSVDGEVGSDLRGLIAMFE